MNLYEQQAVNRRKTWLVMAAFVALFVLLGAGFDAFYLGSGAGFLPIGSIFALAGGSLSAAVSYYGGDRAVLAATGARPLAEVVAAADDANRLKLRQLDNVVDEMALAAGLPRPPVYVVADSDPNAFATGRGPAHASIAVTQGLLDTLNREELQGVIAHEMSHIRNLDVRLMTIVAALVGGVALLSDWARRGMLWGGGPRRRDNERGGSLGGLAFFVLWLIAISVAGVVAQIMAMMVSRNREFLADASAAELTRNPGGLESALTRIESAVEPTRSIKSGSAHLCIADPLGRSASLREGFWSGLFASHPPMAARIAALREMAFGPAGKERSS